MIGNAVKVMGIAKDEFQFDRIKIDGSFVTVRNNSNTSRVKGATKSGIFL
jgi:hypothetical protein